MMKRIVLALLLAAVPLQAIALENDDLLALVAMPLAVAAVSEVADVPMDELMNVVTLLNDAQVPPVQFVEVVRYAPVALVAEEQQSFVDFVRVRYEDGMRGVALVNEIETRYETYGLQDVELNEPRVVTDGETFIPAVVQTRVAETKQHPHGGPPGQLKKVANVQTGAEIVHGTTGKPSRKVRVAAGDDRVRDTRRVSRADRPARVARQRAVKQDDHPGRGHGSGNGGGGKDNGKDNGKGNGKGKG